MTKERAERMLELWLKAEEHLAIGGKSYQIDGRTLTRADGAFIKERIEYWQSVLNNLTGKTRKRIRRVVIRGV